MDKDVTTTIGAKNNKSPKIRSVAYPSYSIAHTLTLTETIYKLFGNSVCIPIEKIAEKTDVSESYLQQQLSSCVQYGFLELKSKEGYKPTNLFIKIYKPLPTENVRQSKIEAFLNPELYKKIIEQENNTNHTIDSLATLLYRSFKVAEKAAGKAAGIFIQNAVDLNLINADNFFSIEGDFKTKDETEFEEIDEKDKIKDGEIRFLPPPTNNQRNPKISTYPPIQVILDDGSISETFIPNGFNKSDIERIIRVLTAYIS